MTTVPPTTAIASVAAMKLDSKIGANRVQRTGINGEIRTRPAILAGQSVISRPAAMPYACCWLVAFCISAVLTISPITDDLDIVSDLKLSYVKADARSLDDKSSAIFECHLVVKVVEFSLRINDNGFARAYDKVSCSFCGWHGEKPANRDCNTQGRDGQSS